MKKIVTRHRPLKPTLVQHAVANWRTTTSGIGAAIMSLLALLAALPYSMGDVANMFPPSVKTYVAVISGVAAAILKTVNSAYQKDK